MEILALNLTTINPTYCQAKKNEEGRERKMILSKLCHLWLKRHKKPNITILDQPETIKRNEENPLN